MTSRRTQLNTRDVDVHVTTRPHWEFTEGLNPYYYDRATQEWLRWALPRPFGGAI